jgi:sodium transport system permease protein
MGVNGSGRRSEALPAPLAVVAAILGYLSLLIATAKALTLAPALGLRLTLLIGEAFLLVPGLAALLALARPIASALALRPINRRGVLVSMGLGGTFWVASLGVLEVQSALWPLPPSFLEQFRLLHEALRPSGPVDAVFSVLAIAVAPAVCEELVFRGIVLPSFLRSLGAVGAAVASAALFGMIHIDFVGHVMLFYRVPFAFAVGLGLAALRLRTRSLYPSLLAHATLNAITFVTVPLTDAADASPDAHPLLGALLLVVGVAASLLVARALPKSAEQR